MIKIFFLFIIPFFSSCSLFKSSELEHPAIEVVAKKYQKMEEADYIFHLENITKFYLQTIQEQSVPLSAPARAYLGAVYKKIVESNELILNPEFVPSFYVIKSKLPFIFSMPRSSFFISTALVENYLKSENLFVAAFTSYIVKAHKGLYEKQVIVPTGTMTTERILDLTRVPLEVKVEVAKWTYYVLKRAGFDPQSYLNWIQIQSKNALDFSLHLGDSRVISREESLFKNFIANNDRSMGFEEVENSSKEFYNFINFIRSVSE